MSDTDHSNVRGALYWFLSFLGTDEWSARKAAMEEHLQEAVPNLSVAKRRGNAPASVDRARYHSLIPVYGGECPDLGCEV